MEVHTSIQRCMEVRDCSYIFKRRSFPHISFVFPVLRELPYIFENNSPKNFYKFYVSKLVFQFFTTTYSVSNFNRPTICCGFFVSKIACGYSP